MSVLRASELIGLGVAKLLVTVDNLIQPKKIFGVILQLVNQLDVVTFEDCSSGYVGLPLILMEEEVRCLGHLEYLSLAALNNPWMGAEIYGYKIVTMHIVFQIIHILHSYSLDCYMLVVLDAGSQCL